MLGMVFTIPAGFGLLVWRSYRSEAARAARGEDVATPGALRWSGSEPRPESGSFGRERTTREP
jgi:hypothetical protein